MESFIRCGVFLSEEDTERCQHFLRLSSGHVFGPSLRAINKLIELYDMNRQYYHTFLDAKAVELGLPEPEKDAEGKVIHYGIDFATREVLKC